MGTSPAPSPRPPNSSCRTSTPTTTNTSRNARRDTPNTQTLQHPPQDHHRARRRRNVVVLGERFHDITGEVVGTQGFYLDVTPSAEQRQESITEALAEIADHRAAIEQAKGVLMYVYGICPDAAFDILTWLPGRKHQTARARRATGSRRPHTQPRRRLSTVAPRVRQAATHSPRTSQSSRWLSARTREPSD